MSRSLARGIGAGVPGARVRAPACGVGIARRLQDRRDRAGLDDVLIDLARGIADAVAPAAPGSMVETGPVAAVLKRARSLHPHAGARHAAPGRRAHAAGRLPTSQPAGRALTLTDLTVRFGRLTADERVSLEHCTPASRLGVVGESAAGKSTLVARRAAAVRPPPVALCGWGSRSDLPTRDAHWRPAAGHDLQSSFRTRSGASIRGMTVGEIVGSRCGCTPRI